MSAPPETPAPPETQGPPAPVTAATQAAPQGDACPRCGAPLDPGQSWCLACGAPARTVLAPVPNWRVPLIVVAVVIVLSATALTVALVTLAGGPTTKTVLTGATPAPAAGPVTTPAATAAAPAGAPPVGATPAGATPAGATAVVGPAAPTGKTKRP